jgi:hypothetical protein
MQVGPLEIPPAASKSKGNPCWSNVHHNCGYKHLSVLRQNDAVWDKIKQRLPACEMVEMND